MERRKEWKEGGKERKKEKVEERNERRIIRKKEDATNSIVGDLL
jgi:hypothetical protein